MSTSKITAALLTVGLLAAPGLTQAVPAEYPFHDGFETGVLSPAWTTYGDGFATQAVVGVDSPFAGTKHLQLGGQGEDGYVVSAVDLHIDLSGRQGVLLDFMIRHENTSVLLIEGLYLSANGKDFQAAWDPGFDEFQVGQYQRLIFDLDELAESVQLEFTDQFTIRYMWGGYDKQADEGIYLDDFRVVPAGFTNLATVTSVASTGLGEFGASATAVGDLDGDGVVDFAIGHPGYSLKRGRTELFSGQTLGSLGFVQKGIFGERMGESMARLGDLDGDGFDELLVGAPSNDVGGTDRGAAYVVSPKLTSILGEVHGIENLEAHGTAVASAGDLDGDGLDDYLVASPLANAAGGEGSGRVTLYRSSDHTALRTFEGTGIGEGLGADMQAGPDLDGDGLGELFIGAPGWLDGTGQRVGRVVAYSGADTSIVASYPGLELDGLAGTSLALLPDLDGDGLGDLGIGAPLAAGSNGTARLLSTATGLELASFTGELLGDRLGTCMVMAGDMDGFGLDDLAIGAGSEVVGSVVVVRLPDLEILRRASVINAETGFGSVVNALGDLNGDGFGDILCSERFADGFGQQDSGQVRVISTVTPPELDEVIGLHCTLTGVVRILGTDLNPGMQIQVDGIPVAFDAISPVEAHLPLGPDIPGGFHDLTLISDLGTAELPSGVARYPALETTPQVGLGDPLEVRLDNGEAGSYVLAFSPAAYPAPAAFEAWGWFHGLELNGVWVAAAGVLTPGDTERFHVLQAPKNPFFVGETFHLQAWTFQADLGLAGFTNRADTLVVD